MGPDDTRITIPACSTGTPYNHNVVDFIWQKTANDSIQRIAGLNVAVVAVVLQDADSIVTNDTLGPSFGPSDTNSSRVQAPSCWPRYKLGS